MYSKKALCSLAAVISVFAFETAIAQSGFTKGKFVINGAFANNDGNGKTVYLSYSNNGKQISDSAIIVANHYHFENYLTEPVEATLKLGTNPQAIITFFLDADQIDIASENTFDQFTVTGSQAQKESEELDKQLSSIQKELRTTLSLYTSASRNKQDSLAQMYMQQLTDLSASTAEIAGKYAGKHPKAHIAPYALNLFTEINLSKNIKEVERIFDQFPKKSRQSYTGKIILEKITNENKTKIGLVLRHFILKDTAGHNYDLLKNKNKVILLDFWASWCVPCRKENPSLVKLYKNYKGKGFTIISISLDKLSDHDKWLQAVKDDHLTWTQLSEYTDSGRKLSDILGIHSIPANLLLDRSGKIIAKKLHGEELDEMIGKMLK